PGAIINGWAFTQHGGTTYWDQAGLVTQTPQAGGRYDTLSAWVRGQRALGGAGLPAEIPATVQLPRDPRTPEEEKALRDYFVAKGWTKPQALLAPQHKQLASLEAVRALIDQQVPATLVSVELPTPRPSFVLKRGEYDQKGQKVQRQPPAF